MAALTDDDIQGLIALEVGDIDPATKKPTTSASGLLATWIPSIWQRHATKRIQAPGLQEAYTRRDCIRLVLAQIRQQVDIQTGQAILLRRSQRIKALTDMLAEVETEITKIESGLAGANAAIAAITKTAPTQPPIPAPATPFDPASPYIDPNDPRYGGSPWWRNRKP